MSQYDPINSIVCEARHFAISILADISADYRWFRFDMSLSLLAVMVMREGLVVEEG